jgi:chromosome segregation ATPase
VAAPPDAFISQTTFYLAWGVTLATVAGFSWQGLRWINKKIQNDRLKAQKEEEARHQETRDFVDRKTKEAMIQVEHRTTIIDNSIKYQEDALKDLKKSTDNMTEKVNQMHIKLTEHSGKFEKHDLQIDKLEEAYAEFRRYKASKDISTDDKRSIM